MITTIFLIMIFIFFIKQGGNIEMPSNEEIEYEKDLKDFINEIDKIYYDREFLLERLNFLIENVNLRFLNYLVKNCIFDKNILILSLGYGDKSRYYLFKDKEFKFMILAFKGFNSEDEFLLNETANLIFEDLQFSSDEIFSFKNYLGENLNSEYKGFFSIKFTTGSNSIDPHLVTSKHTQITYELTKNKFLNYEKKLDDKTIHLDNKIKNSEKQLLSIIGAFIGVFTLVSINTTFLKESNALNNPLLKLIIVNIVTTSGISLLIFLVTPDIKTKTKIKCIISYFIIMFLILFILYLNTNNILLKIIYNLFKIQ